jgi:tRNA(Ile)-lysidine synthase
VNIIDEVSSVLAAVSAPPKWVVAYSGGLDSCVLLHVLHRLRLQNPAVEFRAVHVNHGLSERAADWVMHCQSVCRDFSISLEVKDVDISLCRRELGIESAARLKRYGALKEGLASDEVLLCAHHQDDQAETLLLQLMRGTGVRGLAGMDRLVDGPEARILRPLLQLSRHDLYVYATQNKLSWVEDDSNQNTDFNRNYIRHCVIPVLRERWPAVSKTLSRTAQNCRDADVLLQQLAERDLQDMGYNDSCSQTHKEMLAWCSRLPLNKLRLLSARRRANVLRFWLGEHGIRMLTRSVLNQVDRLITSVRLDSLGSIDVKASEFFFNDSGVAPGMYRIRKWGCYLYLVSEDFYLHSGNEIISWDLSGVLQIPSLRRSLELDCVLPYLPSDCVLSDCSIRFRQGGERIRLFGESFHRSLKQCFQLWRVPPWVRNRVPLLFCGEGLVLVVGYPYRNNEEKHEA